jgi:hypothetical protein
VSRWDNAPQIHSRVSNINFDISGIGIYLNEYKKHLFSKAKFFIPKGIEYTIKNNTKAYCEKITSSLA